MRFPFKNEAILRRPELADFKQYLDGGDAEWDAEEHARTHGAPETLQPAGTEPAPKKQVDVTYVKFKKKKPKYRKHKGKK